MNSQQAKQLRAKLINDPPDGPNWADLVPDHIPIRWNWPGWLPPGFVTILAGQPGIGKSSLCLHLATCYTNGRPWPDGTPFTAKPGKVLWVETEGSHRLNLDRLQSWGFDPAQIITTFFNDSNPKFNFKLAQHKDGHDMFLSAFRSDVRLIIYDSLTGFTSGLTRPKLIHDLLESLAMIAFSVNKPILVTHTLRRPLTLNGHGQLNLTSLLGSPIMAQAPRLIWALDLPNPADPQTRRLSVVKNNLAPFPDPLGFRIDDHGLHFSPLPRPAPPQSQLDQAINFLNKLLADGPRPAKEVQAAAQAAGLTLPTLKRAKKRLRLKSHKQPNQWFWQLPPQ